MAVFLDVWRDTTPMANLRQPNPRGRVTRFDATDRRPDSRSAPDHFPQGRNRSGNHMVHKPVNQNVLDIVDFTDFCRELFFGLSGN